MMLGRRSAGTSARVGMFETFEGYALAGVWAGFETFAADGDGAGGMDAC